MKCDCGHRADRAILTASGLLCFECKAARVCPSPKRVPVLLNRDPSDNAVKELRKAQKRLRKTLPLEWSDERLDVLARRLVRNQ